MKKYLITAFALLMAAGSARAQFSSSSSSYIGLHLGGNLGHQTVDTAYDNATTGFKFGIIGGVQYDHWFNDMVGIGIGLQFDQKGSSEAYSDGKIGNIVSNPDGSIKAKYVGSDDYAMSYLEIPITLKVSFGDGDVRPYITAGPSIGMLLSASETTTNNIPTVTNLKSYLNSTDLSAYIGGGFLDHLPSGTLVEFELGYAAGLSKLYKSQPDRSPLPTPVQHLTSTSGDIRMTLGLMWQI